MENWLKIHENKIEGHEAYSRLFVIFSEEEGYVFAQIKSSFQIGSNPETFDEIQLQDIEMAKSLIKSLQKQIDKIENPKKSNDFSVNKIGNDFEVKQIIQQEVQNDGYGC